jgi:hypothetical protein
MEVWAGGGGFHEGMGKERDVAGGVQLHGAEWVCEVDVVQISIRDVG